MKLKRNLCLLALSGLLTVSASSNGASSNVKEIKLRLAGFLTPNHPLALSGERYFMDQVTELTDGKVTFQYYPAGQLGKAADLLTLTKSGTADIGMVSPAYVPDQLPMSSVGELPNMFSSACEGSWAMYNETQPGGYLYENEFKSKGLHVIFANITAPYEVMTARKPITDMASVKGLKLKTAGGAAADTARALGAVPVQITSADVYTALQRGTVDGRFGVYEFMPAVNSEDLLQYGTVGAQVAAFATTAAMSIQNWNKLSPEIQGVLEKAGRKTVEHFCTSADKNEKAVREMLISEHGWTVHRLSDQEQQKWSDVLLPVRKKWANTINERYGDKAGTTAIKSFEQAVKNGADASTK